MSVGEVAQRTGIPFAAIKTALDDLPPGKTPRAADCQRLSTGRCDLLYERI